MLIFEDNAELAAVLEASLGTHGYHVHAVTSDFGRWATPGPWRAVTADVATFDLQLPEVEGEELLLTCKAIRPDIRRVIVTARGIVDHDTRLLGDAFVEKPFSLKALYEAVDG